MEVCKCMKGHNKGDVNKVLAVREQGRTRGNEFKLDKCLQEELRGHAVLGLS